MPISEIGTDRLAITVARGLCRKAKITSTTSTTASTSSICTWCTEARMPVVRSDSTSTCSDGRQAGGELGQALLDGVDRGDDVGAGLALHVQDDGRLELRRLRHQPAQAPSFTFSALSTTCATSPRRTGAPLR